MTEPQSRVDEFLVRRHALRLQLRRMLAPHDFELLRLPDYRALLDEVRRLPADVRPVLEELSRTLPPTQAKLAATLRSDLEAEPPPTQAPAPESTCRVIPLGPDQTEAEPPPPPIDLLRQAAADPASSDEEVGLLWLERFLVRPAEERLPILRVLMPAIGPRLAALMRLEWHSGDLAGDPALVDLCRLHAGEFPPAWLEFPRAAGREIGREAEATESWVAAADGTGHLVLLLARPDGDGRHTFAVLKLDLWHHGIEDVWGNAKTGPRGFAEVLDHFAAMEPEVTWRRIDPRHAAALVQQAHRFNELHCRLVPPEFWVWYDLYATPASPPRSLRRLWRPEGRR